MFVLTSDEMKKTDAYTSDTLQIPATVLMERAALAVTDIIKQKTPRSVLVVAGGGNNGGDGIAVARQLIEEETNIDKVHLYLSVPTKRLKPLAYTQLQSYLAFGGTVVSSFTSEEYDVIVDAILGIGMSGPLRSETAELIDSVNQKRNNGSFIIAIDIPSGVDSDNGSVKETAIRADMTVTFGFMKRGHCLYPGAAYTGELITSPIGITRKALSQVTSNPAYTFSMNERISLPNRRPDGNKGTFGSVLVIAGSEEMSGACYLAAYAAYRTGAGLVHVFTHDNNKNLIQKELPEAITQTYIEADAETLAELKNKLTHIKSIVLGPGLGQSETAYRLVHTVLTNAKVPIVVDADAINLIGSSDELQKILIEKESDAPLILTPHPLELQRLCKTTVSKLLSDYASWIQEYARQYHAIMVGKGACSVVSDGESIYLNRTGNDGMATGGSGDVLSGIIGGLLAQGENPFDAAVKGTYLHGLCGDEALSRIGNTYALMARDFIEALSIVMSRKR